MGDPKCETPTSPRTENHKWSPADEITTDDIKETLQQCPHCGRYIVRCNALHYCEPSNYLPNPNERERQRRIEASPFPDDDPVLILEHPTSRAYAYHEPNNDDTLLCSDSADQSFVTLARSDAHDQLQSPCQRCERIRANREADQ